MPIHGVATKVAKSTVACAAPAAKGARHLNSLGLLTRRLTYLDIGLAAINLGRNCSTSIYVRAYLHKSHLSQKLL